jgi:hypothetical protein
VRQLKPGTTVRLATPAQYAQRGLTYPLWLADANLILKTRPSQRQSITVEAKRGNPELSTDMLIVLNNRGVRSLVPSTLLFDKLGTFAGEPLPLSLPLADHSAPSEAVAAKRIEFLPARVTPEPDSVATSYAVRARDAEINVRPYVSLPSIHSQTPRKKIVTNATRAPVAAADVPASTLMQDGSQATTSMASKASTVAAAPLPNRPLAPVQPRQMPAPEADGWLSDWPLLAGGTALLLLLVYLAARMLKNRGKPRQSKPASRPPAQADNTVFGLSNEEAGAMHKKWLADQILQKSNK